MTKILPKHGNSFVLRITKEMREYLEIKGNAINVDFVNGSIVLSKPHESFEEAKRASLEQFGPALANLAKPAGQ